MAFLDPKYIKSYNYNIWRPFNPIEQPANGATQRKNNIEIIVDETNSSSPLDLYHGIITMIVKINKCQNGANYIAADNASLINGAWMLINRLVVKYNNISVVMERNLNHCMNIRVISEFDRNYANTIGKSMFYYPDNRSGAENGNTGFASRRGLLVGGGEVLAQIPLRLIGFFQACEENLLPNARISLNITLEDDNVLIHRTVGADNAAETAKVGRVVVHDVELMILKIELSVLGMELFSREFLTNRTWHYMKESFISSGNINTSPAYFRITESVNLLRKLWVWVLKSTRVSSQLVTPQTFNTFNVNVGAGTNADPAMKLTDLQLLVSGTRYIPMIPYTADVGGEERIYHDTLQYGW